MEGIEIEIKRPGVPKPFVVRLHPENRVGIPLIGVQPELQLRLDEKYPTNPDTAAAHAVPALQGGDKFSQIDDQQLENHTDVLKQLLRRVDEPLRVTILRSSPELRKSIHESAEAEQTSEEIEQQMDAASKSISITVPTARVHDLGAVMTMGPIAGVQADSPAAKVGIKEGDVLLSIDGQNVGNPLTLPNRIAAIAQSDQSLSLQVKRTTTDGKSTTLDFSLKPHPSPWYYPLGLPMDPMIVQSLGIAYYVEPTVAAVMPGSPAAEAQIAAGDVVAKIQFLAPKEQPNAEQPQGVKAAKQDGAEDQEQPQKKDSEVLDLSENSLQWPQIVFREFTSSEPGAKVKLWVLHDGQERAVELVPTPAKLEDGSDWNLPDRGFNFDPVTFIQMAGSVPAAFKLGSQETVDNLLMVYRFLQRLGKKDGISVKMMSGPVGIAQMAGMKVKEGFSSFLLFLTMLSANLAVINFLPIPVLDGGHMVFLIYEGLRGKPASERVMIAFTYAGMIFLLTLMLFVLSLDLGWISRR
ncbi:MAG: site-2 protease family protein [Pirellulales bacterium]|nr:site-2 protease family protein [Pirellulales bacterium]